MELIIKELETYKEMIDKYENYKKHSCLKTKNWINNNREKYNEWQREYYKNHFKNNKDYLKKKCESVKENELRKISENPNYLEEKRKKMREKARERAAVKRIEKANLK